MVKVTIEVREDIINGIYCEFCEQFGLELNGEQEARAKEACLDLLVSEVVDNGVDDCASLIDPKEVKYALGSAFWKEVRSGD